MAKTSFEFVVIVAPFSVNLAKKQSKKHAEWKREVGRTAREQWFRDGRMSGVLPLTLPMEVVITTFFTEFRRDVDNVVKPILDGLKQVIYEDDGEIYRLTSQRIDLKLPIPMQILKVRQQAAHGFRTESIDRSLVDRAQEIAWRLLNHQQQAA